MGHKGTAPVYRNKINIKKEVTSELAFFDDLQPPTRRQGLGAPLTSASVSAGVAVVAVVATVAVAHYSHRVELSVVSLCNHHI